MRLAIQVRQREIWRVEAGEVRVGLLQTRPEVPDGVLFIDRHGLLNQPGKGAQGEPRGGAFLGDELRLARLWQREAEAVAADALRLDFKPCGALQISHR